MKPGYKTTEFWLTVAVNLAAVSGALAQVLPPKDAALAMAISNGLYNISRAYVKGAGGLAALLAAQKSLNP